MYCIPFEVVLDEVELLCGGEGGFDKALQQGDGQDSPSVHLHSLNSELVHQQQQNSAAGQIFRRTKKTRSCLSGYPVDGFSSQ